MGNFAHCMLSRHILASLEMNLKPMLIIAGTVMLGHPLLLAAETSFCQGWSFYKGDAGTAADASGWETVDLPHTWNATDAADGGGKDMQSRDGYHRGPGWYRKSINADESMRGKRLFIRFQGASSVADVYLNGHPLGGHKGAFGAFCLELTNQLKSGTANELRVGVDNTWRHRHKVREDAFTPMKIHSNAHEVTSRVNGVDVGTLDSYTWELNHTAPGGSRQPSINT